MQSGRPSRTLLRSAIRKAAHQLLDAPLILNDPIIVDLVPEAFIPEILDALDDPQAPAPVLFRCLFAMRTRFAEDRLAQAKQLGVNQYVIVGCGLDTFPWRQPAFAKGIQIFAADHPASLAWTQGRLRDRKLTKPCNLTQVPVDLKDCQLGEQLTAHGFDPSVKTFCSALGVVQYLDRDAVDALFGFASALPTGSEIVFTFAPPDDELDGDDLKAARSGVASTAALGEPWKSRLPTNDLVQWLDHLGFSDIYHLTPELAQQRYFANRRDITKPPGWEQLIAAIV